MSIQTITKTAIVMGEGDVLTGQAIDSYGVGHFVFMQAAEARAPGALTPELDGTLGVEDADVLIMFKDVAAIERVIISLSGLRDAMKVKP